ncbi:hypothetical protein DPMN_121627 [Dreissena polymorpha]|uniref:BTB domain-containing protein n=1 Tax=Dreissena polymorpha TaxID=45954 RepID=A0A9D4GQF4_DREPO|nr:hypothetical protein DPMN_121627 [Dreissena polymorpha]
MLKLAEIYRYIKIYNHQYQTTNLKKIFGAYRDLFHQPSNKHKTDITLGNHLRDESVRQLVDFCYSSNITVDTQSADKILMAANFLQIKEIEKLCITFLAAQQALRSEVVGLLYIVCFYAPRIERSGAYCFWPVCLSFIHSLCVSQNFNLG